jgi:hypothetical protein
MFTTAPPQRVSDGRNAWVTSSVPYRFTARWRSNAKRSLRSLGTDTPALLIKMSRDSTLSTAPPDLRRVRDVQHQGRDALVRDHHGLTGGGVHPLRAAPSAPPLRAPSRDRDWPQSPALSCLRSSKASLRLPCCRLRFASRQTAHGAQTHRSGIAQRRHDDERGQRSPPSARSGAMPESDETRDLSNAGLDPAR